MITKDAKVILQFSLSQPLPSSHSFYVLGVPFIIEMQFGMVFLQFTE